MKSLGITGKSNSNSGLLSRGSRVRVPPASPFNPVESTPVPNGPPHLNPGFAANTRRSCSLFVPSIPQACLHCPRITRKVTTCQLCGDRTCSACAGELLLALESACGYGALEARDAAESWLVLMREMGSCPRHTLRLWQEGRR